MAFCFDNVPEWFAYTFCAIATMMQKIIAVEVAPCERALKLKLITNVEQESPLWSYPFWSFSR